MARRMSASLIGQFGSSVFRLPTTAVSMSLTGSRFSPESAPGPFHHGIRGRGGTIYTAALPLDERKVQADMRTSLIGRFGSSTFRLSTIAVSMSLTGSRFSSESALRPFHYGIRGRGGTIFWTALPSDERQVQADMRTHLIHRPARDIFPPQGGARVSSYWFCFCPVVFPWPR